MKNQLKMLGMVAVLFGAMAFTNPSKTSVVGSYGVSATDPARIELTLCADYTFSYQDFSDPAKPIQVSGNWEQKGNAVQLLHANSTYTFHDKWKFDKDGAVAKSRKGMTFYTLCKL